MRVSRVGPASGVDLLFVLGWGNRPEHTSVEWFLDRLVDAGYRVHAVEVPTNGTDFERDYREPVQRYVDDYLGDDYRLLGHSTGGLVAAHLDTARPRVYLSPWWGMHAEGLLAAVGPLVLRLPTSRRIVPVDADPRVVGDLKTESELADVPDRVSPAFLRAIREGQESLPPFREGSRVFCSLSDRIVSVRAVGDRAPSEAVTLYDGGHEFFASHGRERVATAVVAALDDRGEEAER